MTSTIRRSPERIVVGIDGSLCSRAAVRWAIEHARPGDTINLVHVWSPSPSMVDAGLADPADDTAARSFAHHELSRARALPHDETVTLCCDVIQGDARHCLSHQLADVLVIGARGHNRFATIVLGSVSAHLARHCPIPLVVVPCPAHPTDPQAAQ